VSHERLERGREALLERLQVTKPGARPPAKADKRLSGLDADTVLWTIMEITDRVAEREVDPEDLLEEISITGVPDGTDWEDYGGWTAGTVRAGIEAIASATNEDT
jgi:hypothetical protein